MEGPGRKENVLEERPSIHVKTEEKLISIPSSVWDKKGFDFYRQHKSNETFIKTFDDPGSGGMYHWYEVQPRRVTHFGDASNDGTFFETSVFFQKEPIKEAGVNGCQIEDILFIAMHRLVCAESGPFPCSENRTAILAIKDAIVSLYERTLRRQNRGIEGKSINHE